MKSGDTRTPGPLGSLTWTHRAAAEDAAKETAGAEFYDLVENPCLRMLVHRLKNKLENY